MRRRSRSTLPRLAALVVLVIVAGCTPPPVVRIPEPEPVSPPRISETPVRQAVARHRNYAQDATRSGDLATAVTQWQIVTLLAPDEAAYREALAAAKSGVARGVREQLATAQGAIAANEQDRAMQALLRVLALDPEHTEAARLLRDLDRRRMSRIQADRAARARIDDTTNSPMAPEAPAKGRP